MRLLFVINPTSGRASKDKVILTIQEFVTTAGLSFQILETTGQDDDAAIQHEIKAYKPDRMVACGGDGTVQLVARNLINTGIPMGILPLGSANGLAKALDLPQNPEQALEIVAHGQHYIPLDLLKINDQYLCTHLCDVGTNALLIRNYTESGDKGMIGYAKHLLRAIQESDLMQFTIETPEKTYRKDGYMLAFANAHKYGTGVHISEGSVSDGKFEICNVQKIDLESAIKAGLTAINVFIDKDMFSDVITCKEAHITIRPKAHFQIDGEYMGLVESLKIQILESSINVLASP